MTKAERVTQVALKTELMKQQTAEVVDLLLQCIIEALETGDKVELRGFGGSVANIAQRVLEGELPPIVKVIRRPERRTVQPQ